MKNSIKLILVSLLVVLVTSCTKDSLVCGEVTGGDYDVVNDMYYLRVNGKRQWVDLKTYDSYSIGEFICLEYW